MTFTGAPAINRIRHDPELSDFARTRGDSPLKVKRLLPRKILLIRNDRLGDFVLAWPAFALLRMALPDTEIEALVPAYTAPLATICPSIDRIRIEEPPFGRLSDTKRASLILGASRPDWAVAFVTRLPLAIALWRSRIPDRLAPATKIDQFFYNHTLRQRRSQSLKPEWVYNVELARYALTLLGCPIPSLPKPPYLRLDSAIVQKCRAAFLEQEAVRGSQKLVFLHPGHGGSARNWTPDEYAYLGERLLEDPRITLVITAGPTEEELARRVQDAIPTRARVRIYVSRQGMIRFVEHLAFADLWISGSTGPLHLVGALNRATVAFYPPHPSARALRWETINDEKNRLAIELGNTGHARTQLDRAAELIRRRFLTADGI